MKEYNYTDEEYYYSPDSEFYGQEKESLLKKVFLFRLLPVLMVVISMSCLFFSWMTIPEEWKNDLVKIEQYVSRGSSLLEGFLGSSEIAGVDTEEIEELIGIFSDGKLTPNEIYNHAETVKNGSEDLIGICSKLKIENDTTEALEKLASGMTLFRYLYLAVMGTGAITIILIFFRKKLIGNWFFTAAVAAMTAWHGRLIWVMNEQLNGYEIKITVIPFIALILSLPLIRYQKKKRNR